MTSMRLSETSAREPLPSTETPWLKVPWADTRLPCRATAPPFMARAPEVKSVALPAPLTARVLSLTVTWLPAPSARAPPM
ncbi:hypothetical protein D3C77_179770 [compost metagenome]